MIIQADEDDLNLIYLTKLVDLLATCAEGENRHIESLCQTILPLDELLRILNQSSVPPRLKRSFTNYLIWVYMRTAGTMVESGASELPHDRDIWSFIMGLGDEMNRLTVFISQNGDSIREFLKPWSSARGLTEERKLEVGRQLKDAEFFATTASLFLQTFILRFYSPETDAYPEEGVIIDNVARAAIDFSLKAKQFLINDRFSRNLLNCTTVLLKASTTSISVISFFNFLNFLKKIYSSRIARILSKCSEAAVSRLKTKLFRFVSLIILVKLVDFATK